VTDQEQKALIVLRGGDVAGLDTLVRIHQVRAIRTAYNITGNKQMSEDIVADAFLKVYDQIGQFDMRRPFGPWFYRIVVTNALKVLRQTRREAFTDNGDIFFQQIDSSPSPEMEVMRQETQLLLRDTIWALPPSQRAAVVLRYYLDMDERTIARTLGCALGTVKWRLHAARGRLRHSLECRDGRGWEYVMKGELT